MADKFLFMPVRTKLPVVTMIEDRTVSEPSRHTVEKVVSRTAGVKVARKPMGMKPPLSASPSLQPVFQPSVPFLSSIPFMQHYATNHSDGKPVGRHTPFSFRKELDRFL